VLVRGDAWRILVAIASVAVLVIGLWYAVTRRSAPRLVGATLAPVGLIGFLVVAFTADRRGLPLVAVFALVLASAAAARFALHRDPRTLRATPVAGKPAPKPNHPVLLMNPKSGGGKAERFHLVDECRARGIEPIVLRLGDDLLELTEDAIARGADVIGMAGGDGSQALVATVASKHDVPHVCVPAGTRNHFALDLGLDREDVVGALDAFHDGVERRVDLARVNGRVFVNNASMGLYAKIVQSQAYRDAKMKTAADMLPAMLGPDAEPFDLRFTGPDGSEYPSAHLILVSNDPYQLDHLIGRGTRERMDVGTLGVVTARIANATEAVTFVGLEAAGKIRSFRGWLEWDTPRFRVDSTAPVEIGIDGEAMLMDPPLVFESLPGALRIRLPKHAPGFAPAAASVPLNTSTIGALLRTVVGRPVEAA
jgi:diacylglycerol kinase family enzyme